MGIDAGFDMVPRLSKSIKDKEDWDRFMSIINQEYKDNAQVEVTSSYIVFKAGEHPMLPFEGHKFLRFSSKISGNIAGATGVFSYIRKVTRIAKEQFGPRIKYWDETAEQHGYYDWRDVHESFRSYREADDPKLQVGFTHLSSDHDSTEISQMALFEVKDLPGKGKGLVASVSIPEGTRIICEKPLLKIEPLAPKELERIIAARLRILSKMEQRQFLSLHNNFPGKYPFGGIVKTNALPCGPGSLVGGVYPTACLINHDCLPNSHNSWNSDAQHETIHAIRPIKCGEEITISYDRGGPSAVRQAFLRESFGFDCNCSGCRLPPLELQTSDARREKIQHLDDAIGDPNLMMSNPRNSLGCCLSLLRTIMEEFGGHAGALAARLYYDAFQISIVHGDQARASTFAERAYKARVISEGEDSPETQRVKALASKPADHPSYQAYSTNWKTNKKMIPKDLDETQFERWLFREQN